MRLVVTGCGRTGTQYMNQVFQKLGLRSKHEHVYNYHLDPFNPDLVCVRDRWVDQDIEASWLAAPFISTFSPNTTVWHQLRDPLRVLRCWYHHALLMNEDQTTLFVQKVLPECSQGDVLQRSVHYLLEWNKLIESQLEPFQHCQYKIEDINKDTLSELLLFSGYTIDPDTIQWAMSHIQSNYGSCMHPPSHDFTWDMLSHLPEAKELKEQAESYGYSYSEKKELINV